MKNGLSAIGAVIAVYVAAQFTIGALMVSNLTDLARDLDAAPPGPIAPIDLRSSDLCSMLARPDSAGGKLQHYAFPRAAKAADALRARYAFTALDGCSKHAIHHPLAVERLG